MADARRFADLKYGHAGKLTYIPRSDSIPGEPGYLITSRLTSNAPYFQQIGTSAELYAPSKSKLPQLTHSHLPKERNLQKRWLLKSHPEALMGGFSGLTGLMTEDIQHYKKLDKMTSTQPLLTIGQITDRTVPSAPSGCSVLAVATGESGELLRLTRIEESQWAWDDDKGCTLCLSVIDPMDQEDELVWASGGLAFSQIKFATSVSSVGSIRWLLVQKETSTTILCPEYDKAPKHSSQSYLSSKDKLSRISANLAVTLNHRETGGNSHSDVAFNAPADDWKPQLCVVDKCGYWTLWNIHAAIRSKTKMRMSLYRCGHISEGALDEIPSVPQYPPERHGVLFVGGQREDGFWDNALAGFESPGGTAVRSPHILLWNSERFEIVDTETNTFLPEVQEFSTAKLKYDRIIDIQLSPVNQNHVFILTTRYIVWVDVLHPPKGAGTTSKPAILLTCPHAATHRTGLRMTTNRSTEAEGANAMVSVYSSNDSQISLHWFTLAPENGIAQWHSQMTFLSQGEKGKGEPFATQELIIQPLKLTGPSQSSGIGSRYLREGVQFYQGTMLGRDLSVRYCMCFASENPGLQVTLPVSRVSWSKSKQNSHWRRKRRHILHGMAGAVVVPDSMTDEAILSLPRKQQDKDAENLEPVTKPTPRPPSGKTVFNVNALVGAIAGLVRGTPSQSGTGLPIELFNAFQGAIQHGRDAGRLPLVTWHEIANKVMLNDDSAFIPAEDIEEVLQTEAMQTFPDGTDDQIVVTQLSRRHPDEPGRPLGSLLQLYHHLKSIWVEPLKDKLSNRDLRLRETWVGELARDWFLTLHGVAVQDVPLFGAGPPAPTQDSQRDIRSSTPRPSSRSSMSSMSSTSSFGEPDEAFQRLQLLAPSLQPGKLGANRPAKVLSLWPIERGADPSDYMSSVAIASDMKFDAARQRQQRREAKRKALAEKYKRPRSMSRGESHAEGEWTSRMSTPRLPTPAPAQIMSSQQVPASSQSQGPMTMSQPVAGAFGGDRKKVRKTKKKSGFR